MGTMESRIDPETEALAYAAVRGAIKDNGRRYGLVADYMAECATNIRASRDMLAAMLNKAESDLAWVESGIAQLQAARPPQSEQGQADFGSDHQSLS